MQFIKKKPEIKFIADGENGEFLLHYQPWDDKIAMCDEDGNELVLERVELSPFISGLTALQKEIDKEYHPASKPKVKSNAKK